MRIKKSSSLLLAAAVAVAIAAPSAAGPNREKGEHPSDFTNQEHDFEKVCFTEDDGDEDIIAVDGTDILWPPNHREVDYTVSAIDGGDDDGTTTLTTTSTHDETGMNGAGDPSNVDTFDGAAGEKYTDGDDGRVDVTVTLLAERSGQGDGRQYHIEIDATFDEGACDADYFVDVPHDMGVKPQDERGRAADEDA